MPQNYPELVNVLGIGGPRAETILLCVDQTFEVFHLSHSRNLHFLKSHLLSTSFKPLVDNSGGLNFRISGRRNFAETAKAAMNNSAERLLLGEESYICMMRDITTSSKRGRTSADVIRFKILTECQRT